MLAATCSKIGSPAQTEEQSYGQGGDSGVRVVGAGQSGQSGNTGDAIAGWVPQLNGTIIDSTGKPVSVNGNNILQQAFTNNMNGQLLAQGQQIVATPGPNGQLTYSVMPSYQTVNIDGQEALIIPSSGGVNTQASTATVPQAQQALITPTGQIIRAQGVTASGAGAQLAQANMLQNVAAQNVAGFGGLGNIVNIGGNLVNVGGMSGGAVRQGNNLMQAFQLPGFQTLQQMQTLIQVPVSINGQSVMQTIQVPTQNIPLQSAVQQVGLNNNGIVTLGTNAQSLQTLMASQQTQGQLAQQQVIGDDGQIKAADKGGQNQQPQQQQLNATSSQAQTSKVAGLALTPSSSNNNNSAIQTLNVINTPQGQVILSSPPAPQQAASHAQSLPTLTVPSYPQTITANAALSSSTTTTTSSTQSAAVLQSVLAQQQLLQGLASGQNLQLTNQGQLNWLQVSQTASNIKFIFFISLLFHKI